MFHPTSFVTWGILCCLLIQAAPSLMKRSLESAASNRFERQYFRYVPGHRTLHGGRGLISTVGNLLNKGAGWAKDAAIEALKLGHKILLPPLKGIEWITVNATKVLRLLDKKLVKSIAHKVRSSWEKVKAIEFPGKRIVGLFFCNSIFSIADKVTKDVIYFTNRTKNEIKTTLAYSLYAVLKVVFVGLGEVIKKLGFNCVPLNDKIIDVNLGMVNTVQVSNGTACGLNTLEAQNNVTITSDEDNFIIVKMPWVLRSLHIHIGSVDISGSFVNIQNQSVETTAKEIPCEGTVRLQKGTFLRFISVHIEVGEIRNVEIKLNGDMEGGLMEWVIQAVSGELGGVIKNMLNAKLNESEKQISDYLLGNAARSIMHIYSEGDVRRHTATLFDDSAPLSWSN